MNHYANAREAQRREAWARYNANVALAHACQAMRAWEASCVSNDTRKAYASRLYRKLAVEVMNSVNALQIDSRLPRPVGTP